MGNCEQSIQVSQNLKCGEYEYDRLPLGMAYVPMQQWRQTYEFDRGLQIGTIFPELNKPFTGRRCIK